MKHLFCIHLLLTLGMPCLAQEVLPRTALVMGVGEYGGAKFKGGTIPNLPGITTADLPGMEAKLKALGFAVTVVANPTLSQAKEAVDAFSAKIKAAPGVSLFYFSGHGGEYEGKNYLIPRGANISSKADLSDEALSAQRVLNGMEESGAQVNLVFLDCCREDLGKSVGGAEMAPLKAKGSFIGFATRSGDFADPGEEGSPYTRFLLKHLDKPGMSVADMYSLVIGDVKEFSKRVLGEERRPGFYSELDAPFYMVPVKLTPGSPTAPPAMSQTELEKRTRPLMSSNPELPAGGKVFTNSMGMKFVSVPGTQVMMCIHETRNVDYAVFAKSRSDLDEEWRNEAQVGKDQHPVVSVSYDDAEAFCRWLGAKEGKTYRLPTDEEWTAAAGRMEYPWGNHFPPQAQDGNFGIIEVDDRHEGTAPTMSFRSNEIGIYDLGGNVWEFCRTWYSSALNDEQTLNDLFLLRDDGGGHIFRVLRGSSWKCDFRVQLRSSFRGIIPQTGTRPDCGFRVVLTQVGDSSAAPSPQFEPRVARGNPPSQLMPAGGKAFTNSLEMKFVPVPGTQVMMCSTETRVRDFKEFISSTQYDMSGSAQTLAQDGWQPRQGQDWRRPGFDQTDDHPVTCVSWEDAQAFCQWLSRKEGRIYRLPTDHEWSVAVGIGDREDSTQTPAAKDEKIIAYPWGGDFPPTIKDGNYRGQESRLGNEPGNWTTLRDFNDGWPRTAPIGNFKPGVHGCYDLGGNVWEWCADWHDPAEPICRVLRGGSWVSSQAASMLSSMRLIGGAPNTRRSDIGFRCVLESAP
jgi:formylglycine-generating enzyme required for sulfatase activity